MRRFSLLWVLSCMGVLGSSPGPVGRAERPPLPDSVVIAVGGDVLPEPNGSRPLDADHLLDGMKEEFARADLVFLNLEEPITKYDQVTSYKNPAEVAAGQDYILRARNPALPRIFREKGVGLMGLANNHMMDYTSRGLRDTLLRFREAGLPAVGAGSESEAERAFIYEKIGRRVAILAFSDVVPPNSQATRRHWGIASSKNPHRLAGAIERARREADFVVLMMHWGSQGRPSITRRQRQLARVAAKAGCDAVVGMHPHVLQGIEYVNRALVVYSVGNFAYRAQTAGGRECIFVRLIFGQHELRTMELVPVEISPGGSPHAAKDARRRKILAHVDDLCRMFNTRIEGDKVLRGPVRKKLTYDFPARKPRSKIGIGGHGSR